MLSRATSAGVVQCPHLGWEPTDHSYSFRHALSTPVLRGQRPCLFSVWFLPHGPRDKILTSNQATMPIALVPAMSIASSP